jgi:hypothetical protein
MAYATHRVALLMLPCFLACSGGGKPPGVAGGAGTTGGAGTSGFAGTGGGPAGTTGTAGGTQVTPAMSPEESAERVRIASALSAVDGIDKAGLTARYPAVLATSLGYDPLAASNLGLIRSSALGLNAAEETVLKKHGFVISDRQKFPNFTYGYRAIYGDHLPLFISADSILYALHRSYDEMLKQLEIVSLRPTLKALLTGLRAELAGGAVAALGAQTAKDIDVYLAVPLGLLDGAAPAPVAGGSASEIADLVAKANAMDGLQRVELFGVSRDEDFSQFTPRGHYTDTADLKTYFKAMMWLGRIDFRLIETKSDGSMVFNRRQFDGALGLSSMVAGTRAEQWTRLDRTIEAFVGESDNMRVSEFPALLQRLGVSGVAGTLALSDGDIAAAITSGNFGAQRIASHVMLRGVGGATFPLSRTFLLLGQRYVLDSHVFSNVVYDRAGGGAVMRMMPDPLDVAFAALGNNQAAALLGAELERHAYAPDLAKMRVLADDHGESFWGANLYNTWLAALRALSPTGAAQSAPLEIAGTEAWGRRVLNTQLASWAELRHDTILYVKQSYTSGIVCEFPDALVEPSPEFFGRVQSYAARGGQVVASLAIADAALATAASDHFTRLGNVAGMLKEMAEYQAKGTPFSSAHMAFINETVAIQTFCGGASATGWYPKLFFRADPTAFDPTIADVHTQPFDEGGSVVGKVLHVGTGNARLMIVTANTCTGPRAYAGLASSYFQEITTGFKRLDDPSWEMRLQTAGQAPADVPWMSDLIAR